MKEEMWENFSEKKRYVINSVSERQRISKVEVRVPHYIGAKTYSIALNMLKIQMLDKIQILNNDESSSNEDEAKSQVSRIDGDLVSGHDDDDDLDFDDDSLDKFGYFVGNGSTFTG